MAWITYYNFINKCVIIYSNFLAVICRCMTVENQFEFPFFLVLHGKSISIICAFVLAGLIAILMHISCICKYTIISIFSILLMNWSVKVMHNSNNISDHAIRVAIQGDYIFGYPGILHFLPMPILRMIFRSLPLLEWYQFQQIVINCINTSCHILYSNACTHNIQIVKQYLEQQFSNYCEIRNMFLCHQQLANSSLLNQIPLELRMIILNFTFYQNFQHLSMEIYTWEAVETHLMQINHNALPHVTLSDISQIVCEFVFGDLVEPRIIFQVFYTYVHDGPKLSISADVGNNKLYSIAITMQSMDTANKQQQFTNEHATNVVALDMSRRIDQTLLHE